MWILDIFCSFFSRSLIVFRVGSPWPGFNLAHIFRRTDKTHMQDPIENLYYALGELAFAVASADGSIQQEEKKRFQQIINDALKRQNYHYEISHIVFQLMNKEKPDTKTTYDWAMNVIKVNSHYLSPTMKETFIHVMKAIAEAYPPVTIDEKKVIDLFKKDIAPLKGDPVYYSPQ